MPILLFLLWVVFNDRLSIDVIVAGIIVVVLLCLFLSRVGLWKLENDMKVIKRIPGFIGFYFRLVYEVIMANFHMIALVLSADPEKRISPVLVKHKIKLKSDTGRVALANTVTLTPGTVTVDVQDDHIIVHTIDEYARSGLADSALERKIEKMESNL